MSIKIPVFDDASFGLRLVSTVIIGILVAGFLTWFMYFLIEFSEQKMDESSRIHILDFVRLQREESSTRKDRKPQRPEVDKAPPAPAKPEMSDASSNLDAIGISDLPLSTNMEIDTDGFGVGSGEGNFLPIVKVAPVYPVSASSRGLEGECAVEYTVTVTGATRDIKVVDEKCNHPIFKRPSIAAAGRFKYKPRIINGEPVEVRRVRNVFIYVLEKQGEETNE